jgi:steroid delta-isomerase-like uncharacterized protein
MTQPPDSLVHSLVEALNRHDFQSVAGFCAPEYQGTDCGQAGTQIGPAGLDAALAIYLQAFPDFTLEKVETIVQDGRVSLYWIGRGTHLGWLMNIPPSGKCVSVCGNTFLSLREGKIRRAETVWDVAGLLRAIGLLPELQGQR